MKKFSFVVLVVLLLALVAVPAFSSGGSVSGGGQLHENPGAKRPLWAVVSFGGWAEDLGGGNFAGEWEVNLHSVWDPILDGTKFHGSNVTSLNFYPGPTSGTCNSAMNLKVYGEWNHEPGYYAIIRAGDDGSPGFYDTFRITIFSTSGGDTVFDTSGSFSGGSNYPGVFADESTCVGISRTGLDAGNFTIAPPW